MIKLLPRQRLRQLIVLAVTALPAIGCGSGDAPAPPVATPSVTLSHESAPAGSPLDMTYRWTVAEGASFDENYRVFVQVMDIDGERMWDDDHDPPVPTTQWKPGDTVEYTRTVFVPVFPYVGEATVRIGLHSPANQARLPLGGEHDGLHAYSVAKVLLLPQTDNLLTVFKDGWHQAEVAGDNATVEWQWTKKEATLAFRNPKKPARFYLDVDSPGGETHGNQRVQVVMAGKTIDEFTVEQGRRVLRRIALTPELMGSAEMAELQIRVDRTWIPAQVLSGNPDKRELGVRVFHAFIDPR